jgi:hypothetical protein
MAENLSIGLLMAGPLLTSLECRECEKLLDAYTRMAREYLELMRRRKAALLERGWTALMEIDSRLPAEKERRANARQALLDHDLMHRVQGQ